VLEQQINWSEQGWKGKVKWTLGRTALKRLEGGLLRKMDKIHTLSEFTKNVLDASYGLGERITVIPHWCRKDYERIRTREKARAELGWPAQGRMLFAVRRFAARMGLDVAIRAMEPLLKE